MGFTPCKAEQPRQGMELQEKETQKGQSIHYYIHYTWVLLLKQTLSKLCHNCIWVGLCLFYVLYYSFIEGVGHGL